MHPIFRTFECLGSTLQKSTLRNTAPILRKVDLKIGDVFNQNVFHKVGQCGTCADSLSYPPIQNPLITDRGAGVSETGTQR